MARSRRRKPLPENLITTIESMSHDGRGVVHVDGKAVFVDGALPGEKVELQYTLIKRKFDEAKVVNVISAAVDRVEPKCAHFELCGGCSLQHLSPDAQVEYKQTSLLDALKHVGNTTPLEVLPALKADSWGYRRKARLGVKYVHKKEKVLVGFREKRNSFLADIEKCHVLHPEVGEHLLDLAELIGSLTVFDAIAQIEVAAMQNVTALVFRNLRELTAEDIEKLVAFEKEFNFQIYLQSGGPDTVAAISDDTRRLSYQHPDYDVDVTIEPLDFFQINFPINQLMVEQAVAALELNAGDSVLELFCGLGNFTLPIASKSGKVTGVEVSERMVERARHSSQQNAVENTEYFVDDLFKPNQKATWFTREYDRLLLDPPRSGAREILELLGPRKIPRIVYVSCNPGTLARDADLLVNQFGYQLDKAGVMDMFPHTTHVESMAVFTLNS